MRAAGIRFDRLVWWPHSRRAAACAAFLAATIWSAAHATSVRSLNLDELTERAGKIFAGRCVQISSADDAALGQPVTTATFAVDRAVKGVAGRSVTIRFLGGDPTFAVGEEVVLFLYEESALGLTSPVGLGQGKLAIKRDKLGTPIVVPPFAGSFLRNLEPATRTALSPADTENHAQPLRVADLLDAADGIVRRRALEMKPATGSPR